MIWQNSTSELRTKKLANLPFGNMNPNRFLLKNVKKKIEDKLKKERENKEK